MVNAHGRKRLRIQKSPKHQKMAELGKQATMKAEKELELLFAVAFR